MHEQYLNIQNNHEVSKMFQKAIIGKKLPYSEDACEFYLSDVGIDSKFFPMESNENYPSIVRSELGKYSVGISKEKIYRSRCCAVAIVVIHMEAVAPGFLSDYIKCPQIIDEYLYYQEVLQIQLILLRLETHS